jgi:hypothetical protein
VTAVIDWARRTSRASARQARRLVLDAAHRVDRRQTRSWLMPLDGVTADVVAALERGEAAVVPLDDLALATTPAMEAAGRRILAEMAAAPVAPDRAHLPVIRTGAHVPELRAWATELRIMAIAQRHIGVPAVFQGVHARIERPSREQNRTELWHRDREDRRMLKCFVYLDEVTSAHGPFQYVPAADLPGPTQRKVAAAVRRAERQRLLGLTDDQMAPLVDRSHWRTVPVPARTAVFVDPTATYHHGCSRTLPRPALFFVWTSAYPLSPSLCHQYWDDTFPPA